MSAAVSSLLSIVDRVEDDPASLSVRARMLSDRAGRMEGTERHRLFDEAARACAKVATLAADFSGQYAWQADACRGGDCNHDSHPLIRERILRGRIEADPHDDELWSAWVALQRNVALEDAESGQSQRAYERLARASTALNLMLNFDPSNETWAQQRERLDVDMEKLAPRAERKG